MTPAQTTTALPPFTAASFPSRPALECDIVMKGGITSGVVYPLAVCELARTFRLRSVGGASAGAIAAAAAAAAELGRLSAAASTVARAEADPPSGRLPAGFLGFAQFPELLTQTQPDGRSLLFHLFRPQPETKRLFGMLTAGLDEVVRKPRAATRGRRVALVVRLVRGAAATTRSRVIISVLPGAALVIIGVIGLIITTGALGTVLSLVSLLTGLIGALAGVVIAVITTVAGDLAQLPGVGFGLTSGRGADDSELALTPWLDARLQELAGRSADDPPLTFADLQQGGIDLRVMTTNLSRAQPMVMPWSDDVYFFEPETFTALFGDRVVRAMVDHPPPLPDAPTQRRARQRLLERAGTLRPFPRAEDLPIIVATRMSLSFPLLISAVPLHTVDYADSANQDFVRGTRDEPVFDVNWFSDGGLTANLPVHFFDSALPGRPTFAIDLTTFSTEHPRDPDERLNSYLPHLNQGGLHRRTAHWKPGSWSQLLSFGNSLFGTARTWVDEAALVTPGYRDRVVTVYQDDDEGGLNLSMSSEVVDRLSLRGRYAAEKLVDRFGPTGGGWANHRWLRFRTATAALSDWMTGFERGYSAPSAPPYDDWLAGRVKPPSYPMGAGDLSAAEIRTAQLRGTIAAWAQPPECAFTGGRPQQPPTLRLVADDSGAGAGGW